MSDEPTSLHTKKNLGGRPPERGESKRSPISMRTTPTIRAALEAAAERGGRSLAQEIEQRLERSVEDEQRRGGPANDALVANIVSLIADIESQTGSCWTADAIAFGAVQAAIADEVANWAPIPRELVDRSREAKKLWAAANALRDVANAAKAGIVTSNAQALLEGAEKYSNEAAASTNALIDEIAGFAQPGRELYERIAEQRAAAREMLRLNGKGD